MYIYSVATPHAYAKINIMRAVVGELNDRQESLSDSQGHSLKVSFLRFCNSVMCKGCL